MMVVCDCRKKQGGGADNEGKGGRYETKTKKTMSKADICRSDGGSYGAVSGGCKRLGRDECEGRGDRNGNNSPILVHNGRGWVNKQYY